MAGKHRRMGIVKRAKVVRKIRKVTTVGGKKAISRRRALGMILRRK